MVIERTARMPMRSDHLGWIPPKSEKVMRRRTAKAAALGAVDMRPTTGAGAPW